MSLSLVNLFFFLLGLFLSSLILILHFRGKLNLAESNGLAVGAVDRAMLAEQLKSAISEADEVRGRLSRSEETVGELRLTLMRESIERTQYEERSAKIPDLERSLQEARNEIDSLGKSNGELREKCGQLSAEITGRNEEVAGYQDSNKRLAENVDGLNAQLSDSKASIATLTNSIELERRQAQEKLELLEQAKQSLSDQFKSLASEILEEKTKKFTEQNQSNLSQLLEPFKERLGEFRVRVEEIHIKDAEQQATLRAELSHIKEVNRQMTEEAHSLATALKGQSKKQGNWGELVLGNVLDRSGLRDGVDYRREVSFNTDEGRKRPDVVVFLPQSKHLVIDAKVSLNAYTRYVNADDDLSRQQALQEHVSAIASRIRELSDRNYFDLPGINSPEMVFMFIPIESAFVEALKAEESLFQRAIEENVLVATPTTLLTSLNIVRQLWRFEEQNAHTAELAERAGKVYKKLVTFLESMEGLNKQLGKARESFDKAMGQLVSGKDNLIKQARHFEQLGVSVQTALPEPLVAKADLELEHFHDESGTSTDLE